MADEAGQGGFMSGKHGYSDRLDKIRLEIERQNRELAVVAPELLARATPAQPTSPRSLAHLAMRRA